jgi:hypothetical protein
VVAAPAGQPTPDVEQAKKGGPTMIHLRDGWAYDHNIAAWEGKFVWHVVRFKFDRTRITQGMAGTWIAGGTAATREEAERDGMAVIEQHSKGSA